MNRLRFALSVLILLGATLLRAQETDGYYFELFQSRIDNENFKDDIRLNVDVDGSTVVIDVRPVAGEEGGDLDTVLFLADRNSGLIVASNDDREEKDAGIGTDLSYLPEPAETSSRIVYPLAATGSYTVRAARYDEQDGDTQGSYIMSIEVIPPSQLPNRTPDYSVDVSDNALLAAGYPAINPKTKTVWTVLIYYGGDNNLEPGILTDLNEFELAGGANDTVRVVALVDNEKAEGDDGWSTGRLFEISADISADQTLVVPPTIDSPYAKDLGEITTDEGATFAKFLVWGVQNYPAQHYVVAMGSHGAGWHGLITDDTSGEGTILSLPELQAAYRKAIEAAGVEKFDLLINDACLMSSVEYHLAMSEFFQMSIASPEIVINPAHDMTLFTNALKTNTYASLQKVGESLVNTYINRDILIRPSSDVVYYTSSLINLEQYNRVTLALEDFAQTISANAGTYTSLLGNARSNSYVYTEFIGGSELIDIGSLMGRIIELSNDPTADYTEIALKAQTVIEELQGSVYYAGGGATVDASVDYYQNIFFPSNSETFGELKGRYFNESTLPQWGRMLRDYYNLADPSYLSGNSDIVAFHPAVDPKVRVYGTYPIIETALSAKNSFAILTEIVGRDITYGYSVIDQIQDDGTVVRLSNELLKRNENGQLVNKWLAGLNQDGLTWDITLPYITINGVSNFELMKFSEAVVSLDARYQEVGSDTWNDVSMIFDIKPDQTSGTFQRVINLSQSTGAAADVTIPLGSTVQVYRLLVSEDGKKVERVPTNTYTWSAIAPTWEWKPAPNGEYLISSQLTTAGGKQGGVSTKVTVNNDGIDPDLRSNVRSDFGLSISRPETWSSLAFVREGDLSFGQTLSPDSNNRFRIYFEYRLGDSYVEDTTDLFTAVEIVTAKYNLRITSDLSDITVDGEPAKEFTYELSENNENVIGKGFVIVHHDEFGPTVELLGAEAVNGDVQNYDLLKDNIELYDSVNCSDVSCQKVWAKQTDVDGIFSHPLFIDFVPLEDDGSGWTKYAKEDGTSYVNIRRFTPEAEATAEATIETLVRQNVAPGKIDLNLYDYRRYNGKNAAWTAGLYTAQQDGVNVYGRMYFTIYNNDGYAIWLQSPNDDTLAEIIGNQLEPVVDGFCFVETGKC